MITQRGSIFMMALVFLFALTLLTTGGYEISILQLKMSRAFNPDI